MKRALLSALLVWAGCSFRPAVPNNSVTCANDGECPEGYVCRPLASNPTLNACCQGASCGRVKTEVTPDAGSSVPAGPPDGGGTLADAEVVLPPAPPAADGGADALATTGDGAASIEEQVRCSSSISEPQPPMVGRETYCTVVASGQLVWMGLDTITMNDPVSIRAYAVCSADVPLRTATTDPSGAPAPLPAATLDRLVELVNHYKRVCQSHNARMMGVLAGDWARKAPNQGEIRARLEADTGLDVDVPTPAQELVNRYYGVTRYRRGRLTLHTYLENPELISWPARAAAPTRTVIPVAYATATSAYFANPMYQEFDEARRALRGRLFSDLRAALGEIESQIASGALAATVSVDPAGPVVPLALTGQLRTENGAWFDVPRWNVASSGATVTTTPYGRVYGVALPTEVERFFTSINTTQFGQLRANPIRDAYGVELLFTTTLLDLLGDEVKAAEFGFVFTNLHFGYLFGKLFPPPG